VINRLREQLLGNPRLRAGLAIIVALLAAYAVLVLRDAGRHSREAVDAAEARLGALRTNDGKTDLWRDRAQRTRGLLAQYEAEVWRDATLAQAQAAMQDWLAQSLKRAGLQPRELNVGGGTAAATDGAPSNPAQPVRIRARVAFEYQRPALAVFVRALLDGPRRVGLERLLVRTTPTPTAEVELFALYRPPVAPGP